MLACNEVVDLERVNDKILRICILISTHIFSLMSDESYTNLCVQNEHLVGS